MSLETVSDRLMISSNGVGTAHFDPRPFVAKFVTARDRREGHSDPDVYASRFTLASLFNNGPRCHRESSD